LLLSLHPSLRSFPRILPDDIVDGIKKLGFFGVTETAFGADLVSAQLADDFISEPGRKLFLSSACPVAVEYVKLYKSDFSPYITDRASPLLAHARYLRALYGEDIGIVFIGPCIAKKREADV
jgi:iron only hydrogenase large subunit-like protein